MNLIVKGLAVLAIGLVVVASAEAGGRRRRPAATTEYYYPESQPAAVYYPVEQTIPATPVRYAAPRDTTVYRPSVPTYGWNFSPSEGWGFRWSNSSSTYTPLRSYSWGYSPGKGWGFDWR
jgi:hypothetical protein